MNPARQLKASAVKNITLFPSIKANNGNPILVESILESKYCYYPEFCPKVSVYNPQPETFTLNKFPEIDLLTKDKENKSYRPNFEVDNNKSVRYTPDFFVLHHSGRRFYIEVKPAHRAEKDYYQETFKLFRDHLKPENIEFQLVDETQIYQEPLLSNYEELYKYRKEYNIDRKNLVECSKISKTPCTLKSLSSQLYNKANDIEIRTWLAFGYLQFDIHNEPLNNHTEVTFNV